MKTDIEIAQEAQLLPITEVAKALDMTMDDLELYGKYKAKISDEYLKKIEGNKDGKLILVTAINPTPAGEGKTTTSVGLGQAFGKLGVMCEDNISLAVTNQIDKCKTCISVLVEHFVVIVKADVFSADVSSCTSCLFFSDSCNLIHRKSCRADVTVSCSSSENLMSLLCVLRKSTATTGFNVIGMRADSKYIHIKTPYTL